MQKIENDQYLKLKDEKRQMELTKLLVRQENGIKVFEDKMTSTFSEFKKKRAIETENYSFFMF